MLLVVVDIGFFAGRFVLEPIVHATPAVRAVEELPFIGAGARGFAKFVKGFHADDLITGEDDAPVDAVRGIPLCQRCKIWFD